MRNLLLIFLLSFGLTKAQEANQIPDKKITTQMELDAMRYCFKNYEEHKQIASVFNFTGFALAIPGTVFAFDKNGRPVGYIFLFTSSILFIVGEVHNIKANNWIKKAGHKPKIFFTGNGLTYEF